MQASLALYPKGMPERQFGYMDINDLRRHNLRLVIDLYYDGKAARLADALNKQSNEITRIFSTNPDVVRNVGSKLARSIEQVTNLEHGWMDQLHVSAPASEGTEAAQPDYYYAIPPNHTL